MKFNTYCDKPVRIFTKDEAWYKRHLTCWRNYMKMQMINSGEWWPMKTKPKCRMELHNLYYFYTNF